MLPIARYKERFRAEPIIGAVYGYDAADLTVLGLDRAGSDLTLDSFVNGLESIRNYRDIFNGPEVNFGSNKHQGANSSFLAVVKGGALGAFDRPAVVLRSASHSRGASPENRAGYGTVYLEAQGYDPSRSRETGWHVLVHRS